ncbi:hypothetical protein B1A54_10465 [Corynebacterium diphtheriae]|uniref:hypothetical protein n=2 Tax=Corynebacterium diphtheriae TaxID=1717 RepID=UPI000246925B|nr:hypothetical protein [Corynebacterium diphtheriae]AEX79644.1 putative secreted protein [Corynebacterium diphtheriae HC03]OFI50727.1 hypothetical protein BKD82_11670 [Corynebacterium diphtheriae]OSQ16993.1 hypothetical protein B1A54_10465 [Corynebacterium diphtheriae]CAB0662131.1 hypothetical protein CIP107570_01906 [Corynebacterium diphtheriae]
MFKRSLASVAAVAIASGAVVAPANAVAVRPHNNKTCTFSFTAEEGKLIHLNSGKYPQEKITNLKSTIVGPQLPTLRAQIKEYEEALAKDEFNDDLMRKLEESNKQLTAYEKLNEALDACINGKYYNSDQSSGPKKPERQGEPGDSQKPGAPGNPKAPSNPGVTPAPPSNDGAGIGVIFAGAIAAILGILAAALPIIKSILPPQLRALLP